ncbi:MAG: hypothetical protein KAW56_02045 [Candidatus Marinimicrobia bacterium]|nr:hypothetical protein [candidate division WOR-3 bacterium]MCK4445843.1 hypothetical protein [Candidatus Neomarinimicrobiota bacterium]
MQNDRKTLSHEMEELEDLKKLYLKILEDSVPHYESLWTEAKNAAPNAGFFDFRKYKNWRDKEYATFVIIPGNGTVSLSYSALLKETNKGYFCRKRIPRFVILEHAIKAIRWCCLTSAYVDKPYPFVPDVNRIIANGRQWFRPIGCRVDEISHLMLTAAILWDDLDQDTQKLVEDVAIGCAVRGRKCYSWDSRYGGNHDKVILNLLSTIPAAYMFPNHKDHDKFMDQVRYAGIDMVGTMQDKKKGIVIDGKSMRDLIKAWNFYPDCTSDHNGFAHPYYGIHIVFEARNLLEIFAKIFNDSVPLTYTYPENNFGGVLQWAKTLFTDTGELARPHGVEYDSYYGGAAVLAFSYGSTILKDKISLCFEKVAAQLLYKHNQAIKQYDYHSSYSIAALAYLMHKFHDDIKDSSNSISLKEASQSLSKVYHYKYQRCFVHRTIDKFVSFSWGTLHSKNTNKGFCGMVIPQSYNLPAEPLIYCHPNSLTGKLKLKIKPSKNFFPNFKSAIKQFVLKRWGELAVEKIGSVTEINGKKFGESYLEKKSNERNKKYIFDKTGFNTAEKVNWMESFESRFNWKISEYTLLKIYNECANGQNLAKKTK